MIEELLLWLWLFLRVSGFVQQKAQPDCQVVTPFAKNAKVAPTWQPVSITLGWTGIFLLTYSSSNNYRLL